MIGLLPLTDPEVVEQKSEVSEFAIDVRAGFAHPGGKRLSPRYLYDDLGSLLFEAITILPEYGLTRADERILASHAPEIAAACGPLSAVAELGSGSGKKTTHVLRAALEENPTLSYYPIDVSAGALTACEREIATLCRVCPVCADWTEGLAQIAARRMGPRPMLVLFLGSSVGNLERADLAQFLQGVKAHLRSGDFLLLGADLEKDISTMLTAYDDSAGVTSAFNLNLLGRMNRTLGADFDLRSFRHEARWNSEYRRIEMHLVSRCNQSVRIAALETTYSFLAGETIWTESSHKFSPEELGVLARSSGYSPMASWLDEVWPLTEVLWQVV